ncbi:alpha beta-hydrolase, partial [Diplodia corticola]
MLSKAVATGLALVSAASAAKQCLNQTVSVDIEARNAVFAASTIPHSNIDVTWFIQNMTRQGHNFTDEALTGYKTISGTYNVSTQYCWNDQTAYWDLPFHDYNYSYVNAALDAGFATLSYDRLGIGKSQHGDPLNEIQINLEIAALRALTEQARQGRFPNVNATFSRIVHVGHSFGSIQSYVLAALHPTLTDGLVLTGFALNSSFNQLFLAGGNFQQASANAPLRFGSPALAQTVDDFLFRSSPLYDWLSPLDDLTAALPSPPQDLPDGYITPANAGANQYQFLRPPYFDEAILAFAERSKQPVTVGELLTLGGAAPAVNEFAGPVLVFTG